ncbi:unnamed protein product [Rangifer tarandus platyrhynchus]|uniref:Uncharacterized protein n=2 Tax=Rangifer tarandus platyrhynchus TaxID=3082113 RepID=A0ABN8Y3N8_RANTA|nr:unnamed protein product [Rangifer tarandus platyrhynchus]
MQKHHSECPSFIVFFHQLMEMMRQSSPHFSPLDQIENGAFCHALCAQRDLPLKLPKGFSLDSQKNRHILSFLFSPHSHTAYHLQGLVPSILGNGIKYRVVHVPKILKGTQRLNAYTQ